MGLASDLWSVGDTKDIIAGSETLTMEIVGFNHDQLVSGGYAGISLGLRDLMQERRQINPVNTNMGSFVSSDLYSYLNETLFLQFPPDLQSVIKPVYKKTSGGGLSPDVQTDEMKLFLFSLNEVYGPHEVSHVSNDEGAKYARFTGDESRVKHRSSVAESWWVRSPYIDNTTMYHSIASNGAITGMTGGVASAGLGICFGFCI